MSTDTAQVPPEGGVHHKKRFLIYGLTVVLLGALMAWGLLAFKSAADDKAARHKAHQLQHRLKAAGLPEGKTSVLTKTFGKDGGMVCEDPDTALGAARYKLGMSNGATGPGQRPVITDKDLVQGETLVIETYCPDKLPQFTSDVKKMKFGDTVDHDSKAKK